MEHEYEYVRAIVDCGSLRWEYKLKGTASSGSMSHDEDVSEFSASDIKKLTRDMLGLGPNEHVDVLYN